MNHIRHSYIIRLLAAVFALALTLAVLPPLNAVSAADSWGNVDTAERLERAVNEVSPSDSARILDLASAFRAMTPREQKRVRGSVIQRLGDYYCSVTGYTERVVIENANDFTSGSRIPSGSECYGAALAAQRSVTVYVRQRRTTGTSALSFDTDTDGKLSYDSPIVLYIALPGRISSTNNYDLRDGNGRVASFDIRRGCAVFTAYSDGEYRIIKKSSSAARRARDYDRLDVFWQKVADAISGAADGYRVNVNIGSRREVPADILRELSSRPLTLLLRRDSGQDIEIYGKDVGAVPVNAEYYTATSLANTYNPRSAARKAAAASSSSAPQTVTPAVPMPAPAAPVKPVAPPAPVMPRPQPSSSASSIPTINISGIEMPKDEKDRVPDIEILPEEDDDSSSQPPSKPTDTKPGERAMLPESFMLFTAAAVVLAVVAAAIVTLIIYIKGKAR